MVKGYLEKLDPKHKKILAAGGAVGGFMLLVTLFSGDNEPQQRQRSADSAVRHVFSDRDTREVTFESISTQLSVAERQNQELREEMARLRRDMDSSQQSGIPRQISRELDSLSRELDLIREENRELRELSEGIDFSSLPVADLTQVPQLDNGSITVQPEPSETQEQEEPEGQRDTTTPTVYRDDPNDINVEDVFRRRPAPPPSPEQAQPGQRQGEEEVQRGPQIISYYQQDALGLEVDDEIEHPIYIPSGSIVSGVLLNGIDAPTGQGARRDPFPVTVRVKHEAILPNRFSADVKECFLIVSGYGDLSSERAYLRGEVFSCVTNEGDIIETEIESYAVGEDGKAGLRGRLVSKQGALIARSMVAGFFSGVSQAFNVSPIPVLNTTSTGGQTQYQTNYSSDLLQGAGAQGASQALDRVAQFYVDMAESIFPVIEIDAGREVDVILTRGMEMRIRDPENP